MAGAKTGCFVKPEILERDRSKYGRFGRPKWNRDFQYYQALKWDTANRVEPPEMERELPGQFIMDILRETGEELKGKYLLRLRNRIERDKRWEDGPNRLKIWANKMEQRLHGLALPKSDLKSRVEETLRDFTWVQRDADPAEPWKQALDVAFKRAEKPDGWLYLEDLCVIRSKVQAIGMEHSAATSAGSTRRSTASRQDALRDVYRRFGQAVELDDLHTPMRLDELKILKASCAYMLKGVVRGFFDILDCNNDEPDPPRRRDPLRSMWQLALLEMLRSVECTADYI